MTDNGKSAAFAAVGVGALSFGETLARAVVFAGQMQETERRYGVTHMRRVRGLYEQTPWAIETCRVAAGLLAVCEWMADPTRSGRSS